MGDKNYVTNFKFVETPCEFLSGLTIVVHRAKLQGN